MSIRAHRYRGAIARLDTRAFGGSVARHNGRGRFGWLAPLARTALPYQALVCRTNYPRTRFNEEARKPVRAVQYVDLQTGTVVGDVPDPAPGAADVIVAVE